MLYTQEDYNKIALLPAGKTCKLEGRYGITYEFLKDQSWNGDIDSNTNKVQIAAYYDGKTLASVDKEAWITNPHFDLDKILKGQEVMRGAVTGEMFTCPVEEFRAKGYPLDETSNQLFEGFLDMCEFELHSTDETDTPTANEGEEGKWWVEDNQQGWLSLSSERFNNAYEIMERLDSCFSDYVIDALEDDWNEYDIYEDMPDNIEEWTAFLNQYDNQESFEDVSHKGDKNAWTFIQEHRFDLNLCKLYANECKDVDLDKIYEKYNPARENQFTIPLMSQIEYGYDKNEEFVIRVPLGYNEHLKEFIDAARANFPYPELSAAYDQSIYAELSRKEHGNWKMLMSLPDARVTPMVICEGQSISLEENENFERTVRQRFGNDYAENAFSRVNQYKAMLATMELLSSAAIGCGGTVQESFKNYGKFDKVTITYNAKNDEYFVSADSEDETVDAQKLDYDELETVLKGMGFGYEPKEALKSKEEPER